MVISVGVFVNDRLSWTGLLCGGGTNKLYCRLWMVEGRSVSGRGSLTLGATRETCLVGSWILCRIRVAVLLAFYLVMQSGGVGWREGG